MHPLSVDRFQVSLVVLQGSCKYLLAQTCDKGSNGTDSSSSSGGGGFSVRITNDARKSSAFSWTRTITVKLESGMKVSLLQKLKVKIDGKRVALPYIELGSFSIIKDGYRVVLRTNEGKIDFTLKAKSLLCKICSYSGTNQVPFSQFVQNVCVASGSASIISWYHCDFFAQVNT